MPNAHFDVVVISRGGGHRTRSVVGASAYRSGTKVAALAIAGMVSTTSVVASAAYRSGEKLYAMEAERYFDYTRKEDVLHQEIMLPENAPVWAADRQMLWNRVEAVEKRKDAQLARDVIAALPRELNTEQQIALVREFVQTQFVSHGAIADIAIHDKESSDGGRQPHTHIMLTMREISVDGFGKKKREWNKPTLVSEWRDAWEQITNRHLEAAGRSERLSLRSYKEQGIDKIPGKHLGYEAWHLEQKGEETRKGDHNRAVNHENAMREIIGNLGGRERVNEGEQTNDIVLQFNEHDTSLVTSSVVEQTRTDSDTVGAKGKQMMSDSRASAHAGPTSMGGTASRGEVGNKGSVHDDPLEALHRAALRVAVQGLVRHSVHQIAEQMQRWRAYGQALLAKTIDVARNIFDRYATQAMQRQRHEPPGQREERER